MPVVMNLLKEKFANVHDTIAMFINQIIEYIELYLPYEQLFAEALPSDDLRKLLTVALHWKKFWARKYFRLYWMKNK